MEFFREVGELQGNQGMEEEEGVMSVKSIAMIVPPELQDLPETPTPESSANSSAREGFGDNHSSPSEGSSLERTPNVGEDMGEGMSNPLLESVEVNLDVPMVAGWENKTISGRLSNLRKAPHTLGAKFRFRANLHHEIADCTTLIKGYKRLEEIVRQYHVPRTILLRTGTKNERAYTVSLTGWILVYVDHFDADLRFPLPGLIFDVLEEYELALTKLTPNSIKFIIGFMLLCARLKIPAKAIVFKSLFLCWLSTTQTRWYYISGREKMVIFTNMRNKVSRWKRQFVFVQDTRTERVSNDLAARLSRWRLGHTYMNYPMLTPDDLEPKDKITNYVKAKGLVDLEALVTLEVLAVHGFVDITNLFSEGEMSSMLERQRERAQRLRARGAGSSTHRQTRFDERSLAAPRSSSQRERSSNSASLPHAERRVEVVSVETQRRTREDSGAEDDMPLIRRRLNSGSQSSAIRSPDAARRQNRELTNSCKQLTSDKASLEDEVNRLQSSEMANRGASAKSRADELANKVNQLKEELEKVQAEKESGFQVPMDEVVRAVDRAKKAEVERDNALNNLSTLKRRRCIGIARAQGAEWLVGADMFKDAVAMASMNTTIEIYNDVRGKVLKHRLDFPIGELAFFEGEEFGEEGKSLASPTDTTVRLKWELNEDGVPIWPSSVLEKGEDFENLPRFDS
ncbi:hypothetical protein SLEP1_g18738 [Rubroshorea leprosula]|uniref:Transposase (putative) gypsy type domain-containing protein n=1 Tax=Rubroshorea leprosula TaxID=152421 RepID=A0AAV5IYJ5_9ROSI|nr:hypothetical protein SLEP1_g18738 [Rubroshorea leprosula]